MKKLLIIAVLILLCLNLSQASSYYWVGGTGKWTDYKKHWTTSSGGTSFYTNAPTSLDDVYFDSKSFTATGQTVTVDSVSYCRSIDWTGATKNPSFVISQNFNIYGSLTFIRYMSFSSAGFINFNSQKTGNTIRTAGRKFTSDIYFNGKGGDWTMQDSLDLPGNLFFLTAGSLFLNDNYINCNGFYNWLTYPGKFDLGKGTINCISFFDNRGLINSPNGSIIVAKNQPYVGASINTLNKIILGSLSIYSDWQYTSNANLDSFTAGKLIIYGNVSEVIVSLKPICRVGKLICNGLANLALGATVDTLQLNSGSVLTVASTYTLAVKKQIYGKGNCHLPIAIQSSTATAFSLTLPSGTVTMDHAYLRGVNASGGATFKATNAVDLGNNSGWSISAGSGKSYYWVGGSGNWSDSKHWSTTSGGAGGSCNPGLIDDVYFDSKSFTGSSQKVTLDSLAFCNTMDWTSSTNTPTFYINRGLYLGGSLTFINAMTMTQVGAINFISTKKGNKLTSAGNVFTRDINFNGKGGEWIFQDNITQQGVGYYLYTNLLSGELNTNGKVFTGSVIKASANTVLTFGNSNIYLDFELSSSGTVDGPNSAIYIGKLQGRGTLNCLSRSVIGSLYLYNGAGGSLYTMDYLTIGYLNFKGGGVANGVFVSNYGKDTIIKALMEGSPIFNSSFLFDTLICQAGSKISFASGKTQVIRNALISYGSCTGGVSLQSTTSGSQATISKSNTFGNVVFPFATLKDIATSGGATFSATNAKDLGNNSGWTFTSASAQNYYWIGGTGKWSQSKHWANASGGTSSGCVPSGSDSVYFDANSFTATGQVVTIDSGGSCYLMDWSGAKYTPKLIVNQDLNIYGSIYFISAMKDSFSTGSNLNFLGTQKGNKIRSGGHAINAAYIRFLGKYGEWTLEDSFTTTGYILLDYGKLYTNGFNLKSWMIATGLGNLGGSMVLGTSTVRITRSLLNIKVFGKYGKVILENSGYQLNFARKSDIGTVEFNSIIKAGSCNILLDSTHIGLLHFKGTSSAGIVMQALNIDTVNKVIVGNNIFITNSFIFDTLQILPGATVKIDPGATLNIRNELLCYGSPGVFCTLQSYVSGKPATITKASGNVCVELTYLQDIKAIGGASYTAGNVSVNLGGNSGWAFSAGKSCLPRTIKTDSVISKPYCSGIDMKVPYHFSGGGYNPSNNFIVQLSDSTGSFVSPDSLGFLNTNKKDTIIVKIPNTILKTGTGYRVRVVSTSPVVVGSDNGSNLTIKPGSKAMAGADTGICKGNSVNIGTNPSTGFTYSWLSIPAGFTNTSSKSVVTPSVNTTYVVKVINSTSGCTSFDSVTIKVASKPGVPVISTNSPLCEGSALNFSVSATSALNYLWTGPNSFSSTLQNPTLSKSKISDSGIYSVVAINGNCSSATVNTKILINKTPGAITGTSTSICSPTSIALGGTGISGNTYLWSSKPLGFASSLSSINVTPTITTTYYLTETDTGSGCQKTDSAKITIGGQPNAKVIGNASICSGKNISIGGAVVSGNSYSWTSNPIGFTSTLSNPSVNPLVSTMYYLTEKTGTGCSKTDSVYITVNPLPLSAAGKDATLCKGDSVGIGSAGITGLTYSWTSNPSGYSSTLANPYVTPAITRSYFLNVINTVTGCTSADTVIITVNPSPSALVGANKSICQGGSVTIGAASVTGNTYSWTSNPPGFTSTISNPSVSPSVTTKYYLTETITASSCSKTDSVTITVNPKAVASAGNDTDLCQVQSVKIGDSAVSGYKYSWTSKPAGFTSTLANVKVNPALSTVYYLTVTNLSGCTDKDSVSVTINTPPGKNAGADRVTCAGKSTTLGFPSVPGINYSWTSNPAGFSSTIANPTVNPVVTTAYYLSQTISSSGCMSVDTVLVTANPLPLAKMGSINSICAGKSAFIGDTAASGNIYSWTSRPAGFYSVNSRPKVSPKTNITYFLTEVTSKSCVKSDSLVFTVNPIPVINIGNDTSICSGQTLQIGQSGNTGISYAWTSRPAGFISTSPNPSINPTLNTTYHLDETITATGCQAVDSIIVKVNKLPNSQINGPAKICENSIPTYYTSNTPGNTYLWKVNKGTVSGAGGKDSVRIHWTNAGKGLLQLIETNAAGCSDSDFMLVDIHQKPKADFTGPNIICENAIVNYIAKYNSTDSCTWKKDGVLIAAGYNMDSIHLSFAKPGNFAVLLRKTDSIGCSDSFEMKINVNPKPNAGFKANRVCFGGTTLFTDSLSGTNTESWDFGDSSFSNSASPTHTYKAPGVFTVHHLVTNSNGCPDSSAQPVIIDSLPRAMFSILPTCFGDSSPCVNMSIGSASYAWYAAGGQTSNNISPVFRFSAPGLFNTKLVVTSAAGCKDSMTSKAFVIKLPEAHWTMNEYPGNYTIFHPKDSTYPGYFWDFGDSTDTTLAGAQHYYPHSGKFFVHMRVWNKDGCHADFDSTINLIKTKSFQVQSLPNPFTDVVTVRYALQDPARVLIQLYSVRGKFIGTFTDEDQSAGIYNFTIDVAKYKLSVGTYLLKIKVGDQIEVLKLVMVR